MTESFMLPNPENELYNDDEEAVYICNVCASHCLESTFERFKEWDEDTKEYYMACEDCEDGKVFQMID